MKITKVMHFYEDDKDCGGDYLGIEIFLNDSETPLITYGDHYHDKGMEKAEGFVEGFQKAWQILGPGHKADTETRFIADANDGGEWPQ